MRGGGFHPPKKGVTMLKKLISLQEELLSSMQMPIALEDHYKKTAKLAKKINELDNEFQKDLARYNQLRNEIFSAQFSNTESEEHSGFRRGDIVSLTNIEEIYYDIQDIWNQHDFKIYKENFKDKKKFFSGFIREHGSESLLNLNYKILAVGTSNVRIEEVALIEAANTLLLLVSFYGLKKEK